MMSDDDQMMSDFSGRALSLGIIFDSYRTATTKELTQNRRGSCGRRVHIGGPEQGICPRGKTGTCF
jgi:hypothetical protein